MGMFDEFYDEEQHYFDSLIDELKDSLRKEVKSEVLKEMEALKKENAELQEIKANFNQIKQEYEEKKRNYEWNENALRNNYARKRIKDLLDEAFLPEEVYRVVTAYGNIPWCGKCDEKRRTIKFKAPSGKKMDDECPTCGKRYAFYIPKLVKLTKIYFSNSGGKQHIDGYYERVSEYDESRSYKKVDVYEGKPEDFNTGYWEDGQKIFLTKEAAQEVCDCLNIDIPKNVEVRN